MEVVARRKAVARQAARYLPGSRPAWRGGRLIDLVTRREITTYTRNGGTVVTVPVLPKEGRPGNGWADAEPKPRDPDRVQTARISPAGSRPLRSAWTCGQCGRHCGSHEEVCWGFACSGSAPWLR
ncbi:MAG: hypothetical protein UY92_C0009G0001 [Candidatus Magasanikbacteria bacterium GW2011_GWA2_56_11]|uniref:Uncharacterized protein n=1 Tax=Candidatus Magasanikbacteria bacterium GW2011_GWA2_56_11 TaxID=1619044 RepID=A0A0G2B9R6_9BACT|nr:MAG: hypothetical protein UY92_C0009G0001 [Candidatus Magasanikbacteria bacterium GW2011_GWA2_56_11]